MNLCPFDVSWDFPRLKKQLIVSANGMASKSMTEEVTHGSTLSHPQLWVDFMVLVVRTISCKLVGSYTKEFSKVVGM